MGAVVVDSSGRVAAGVSSGGIAMSLEGRVGDSAVFGAGAWAADPVADGAGVATSTTGVGENIIRTMLARSASQIVQSAKRGSNLGAVRALCRQRARASARARAEAAYV